jgi:hypothetical protein
MNRTIPKTAMLLTLHRLALNIAVCYGFLGTWQRNLEVG